MVKKASIYIGVIIFVLSVIGCTKAIQTVEGPEENEEIIIDESDEIAETEPKEPSVIIYDENGSVYEPIHISLNDFYVVIDEVIEEYSFSSEWERDKFLGILLIFNSYYMDDKDVISVYHDYLDNFGYTVLMNEYEEEKSKIIEDKEEYSFSMFFIDPVLRQEAETFDKYYDEYWKRKTADKFKIQLSGVDLKSISVYNPLIYLESERLLEEWEAQPGDKVGTSDALYIYYSKMDPELYSVNYFNKIIKSSDVEEYFNHNYEVENYKSSHENGKINLSAEINSRDMEAMYGIKDAPKYTDEEVALAQENVKNNYEDYNNIQNYIVEGEKLDAIAADYYAANQNFFGQLYLMTKDIDKSNISKLHATKVTSYYDEVNDWYIEITSSSIYIRGINFSFTKEFWPVEEVEESGLKPGDILNENLIMISKDGAFLRIYSKEELLEQYNSSKVNYDCLVGAGKDASIEKLEEIGYKSIPMEYECVSFIQLEDELTLEK